MWFEFLFATALAALLLYGPGYLFFRGLRFSKTLACCCAPLFSVCIYGSLPILYYELGIPCGVLSVAGPALLVGLGCYLLALSRGRLREHRLALSAMDPISLKGRGIPFDLTIASLYVLVAMTVCVFVFVLALPQANSFAPRADNITHLNLTRAFLDSGKWSSLHTNTFLTSPQNERSVAGEGGFYPCAWNCVVVLTCLLGHVDLMLALNAVVALSCSVMFSLGMYAFLRTLLPHHRRAIVLGVVAITGFANWPWHYLYTGPLYPNQFGISLQFSALALILLFAEHKSPRSVVPQLITCGIVSFVALALAHPTTIFSVYVFMAFYGAHRICGLLGRSWRLVAVLSAYALAVVGVWIFCYQLPMLHSVIGYVEIEQIPPLEAAQDLLAMQFVFTNPQVGISALAILGIIIVAKQPERRWLLCPVAFFALGYVASRADWWTIKHWVAALWYTDRRRMAINMVLYLMPIVALSLDALLPGTQSNASKMATPRAMGARIGACAALLVLIYVPIIPNPITRTTMSSPLNTAALLMRERYRERIYSPEEVDFVNRAMELIPPNSLVINSPGDGSMWAYGVNDLNTFYRDIHIKPQTSNATIIRKHLNEYARSRVVQQAVHEVNASYVLLLDKGVPYQFGFWLWQYAENQLDYWKGIDAIRDDTPGFTTVLSQGRSMRLYKIEQLDGA